MKARHLIAAMLLLSLAACQTIDQETSLSERGKATADSAFFLTIKAVKSADTKGLWIDNSGNKDALKTYWTNGDLVSVYRGGTWLGYLTASCTGDKPTTATLSGEVSIPGLAADQQLTLMIPGASQAGADWQYTQQDGTLSKVGSNYDYATATVTIQSIETTSEGTQAHVSAEAKFQNQQSIYRFTFSGLGSEVTVTDFSLSAQNAALVRSRAWDATANSGTGGWTSTPGSIVVNPGESASGAFFVALRNESTAADNYNFYINGSDHALYLAAKPIPATVLGVPGKFINGPITATKSNLHCTSGTIDNAANVF